MLINHVDAMDNFDINIMDSLPDPFCGLPSISIMAYPPSSEPPRRLLPPDPRRRFPGLLPPGPAIPFAQPVSSMRVGIILDKEGQKTDRTYV